MISLVDDNLLKADLVLINGNVITVDVENSIREAVAVKGNRIVVVGSTVEVKRLIGESTEVLDLAGKTVLPGIIDSHTHPTHGATRLLEIDCRAPHIKGIKDIQTAVREKAKSIGPGGWVKGANYNDSKLTEHRQITRWELDEAAPENPVILVSDTGHQCVVNSRALEVTGVTLSTVDPAGGKIDRRIDGEVTGLLYETASHLVTDKIPPYSLEEIKEGLRRLFDQYCEWGITSTHDASGQALGIRAYHQLFVEGYRKVRVSVMVSLHTGRPGADDALESMASLGVESGLGNEWLRYMSLKIMGDGSGAGGTAAVYVPQHRGPKSFGFMTTPKEEIEKIVMKAHDVGIRCSIHAIGDRGIDIALDCIEKAQKTKLVQDMRHRIEHNSFCTPKQLVRIKKLGVAPSSSIGYMYGIGDQYAENFGPERSRWLHPHKTMKEMGIIAGGNNDCPVTFYSPFVQIYTAVTRKSSSGQVIGPEEGVCVMDALRIYTWNGAYLAKEEQLKGSIEPGKLADMIIIDRDILSVPKEEIKDIKVLTTIVDGKIIFQRKC